MTLTETRSPDADPDDASVAQPPESWWRRWFGPLTPTRLVLLLVVVAFFGGAVGYAFRDAESQAKSAVDVGFLRDMTAHHQQAVQISKIALYGEFPDDARAYVDEIITQQQYEIGLMQATLYRLNEPSEDGDDTVMGWMGMAMPTDEMPGLASSEELARLEDLDGDEAASLFFSLMSRHHLGGVHMAEATARDAKDPWIRDLASRMAAAQTAEINEYRVARQRLDLPLLEGYQREPSLTLPDVASSSDDGLPGWVPVAALAILVSVALVVIRILRRGPTGDDDIDGDELRGSLQGGPP
ncbi:DUF305 domain-containing protein [Iamia majanohamensis]|uniref:DUF305 domain-containing protein n=1 Tax=Iamia majanohamensis TaxID=467976 RepID=A0AAF0BSA4_9ACTN|nr:DUF305 domain-containing protein [Iamia majanohamensis]WCO67986.1 DUF305 domain-containing protein [Iamia majanohamensis]